MLEPVRRLCQQNDLPWTDEIADRLTRFLDLLDEFRESMNLIGPLSNEAIIRDLVVDSLAPAAARSPTGPILDVGSGAGFPGIPLAIVFPDLETTLIEPRKKRHTFLKIARTRLELDNLTPERTRLQQLEPSPYNFVIAKAFKPPTEWIRLAHPWLEPIPTDRDAGGIICMTRPDRRDDIEWTASDLDMQVTEFIEDTADIGAPPTDPPRAIAVVNHRP